MGSVEPLLRIVGVDLACKLGVERLDFDLGFGSHGEREVQNRLPHENRGAGCSRGAATGSRFYASLPCFSSDFCRHDYGRLQCAASNRKEPLKDA